MAGGVGGRSLTVDDQRWCLECTWILAGRRPSDAPEEEPQLHLAIFKAAQVLLASALCKPPEQSLNLALLRFNSGILLGSSLALTPAGAACTGLKGKEAGAERSSNAAGEPLLLSLIALKPRVSRKAEQEEVPRTKGFEHQSAGGFLPEFDSGSRDARAAAMGSTDLGLLGARQQLRGGPSAGAASHSSPGCCALSALARAGQRREAGKQREKGSDRKSSEISQAHPVTLAGCGDGSSNPKRHSSSLPTNALCPVMQKASV